MYKLISDKPYVANPVTYTDSDGSTFNLQSVDYHIPESLIGESILGKNIGIHIHYHGGSWFGGDKTGAIELANAKHAAYKVANQPIDDTIIISVNYRLTRPWGGQVPPLQWNGDDDLRLLPDSLGEDFDGWVSLEDIYNDSLAAFEYVINDLGTNWVGLDLDTAKITLSGYSAGSHIISTLLLRTESYFNANNYLDKVQDVILYAPPVDLSHYIEGPSLEGHPENPNADGTGKNYPGGAVYDWLDIDNAAELNFLQRVADESLLSIVQQPAINQDIRDFLEEDITLNGITYERGDLNLSGSMIITDVTVILRHQGFEEYDQHMVDHILIPAHNDPVMRAKYGLPETYVNNNWLYKSYTTRDYVNGNTETTVSNPLNDYWTSVGARPLRLQFVGGGVSGIPDVNDLKIWQPFFKYNSLGFWFASWISALPSPYSLSDYNPTELLANNQASLPLNYNIHIFHGNGDTLVDYGVAQTFKDNYNVAAGIAESSAVAQMTTIVDDPSTPHTPLVGSETSGPLDHRYEWNEADHNLLGLYHDSPEQGFDDTSNLWSFPVPSTSTTTSISQAEYDSILDNFGVLAGVTDITLSNTTVSENSIVGTIVGDLSSVFAGSDTLTASEYAALTIQHTFTVANSDSSYTFFDAFEVNSSKQLVIKNNILDHEAANTVQVNIRVTDQAGLTFDKLFLTGVLDVNEAPNFVVTTLTTPEHTLGGSVPAGGTHVSHIQGADPDNDTITYSIVGGDDAALFEIASSGEDLNLVEGVSLDYETQNQLTVTIRATDPEGLTFDKVTTISVTNINEAPTDITLSSTSVQENSIVGTVVGDLTTTDVDINDTHILSLVGGTGSDIFEINTNNQLVVKSSTGLDYETLSQPIVIIRATDQSGLAYDKTFTISVTNINEAPTDITLSSTSVQEHSALGTVVGDLTTTDADINDTHSFSVVGGTGSNLFEINTNNQLVVKSLLDANILSSPTVIIRATDQSGLTYDKTFTISVTLYTDLRNLQDAVQPYRGLGTTSRPVKTTSVSEIIPDHLALNNDYISFLDGYISFLEQHKDLVEYLSIIDNKDIDFRKELNSHLKVIFGTGIPDNYKGNINLLYKDLMDLYRTSGTVESIQLFFKIFYESPEAKVTYPKHNLLIPSPNVSANGMLSNTNIKVQDSLFYQLYSYFISNTNVTRSQWGAKFLKGQHPAGYKMFSELVYELTATTKIFRQLNHPNTCMEPNGSYICSMYILDLISRPSTADAFIIHAVDNLIEKILLLYSIDRPFGMNAWFDDVKFKLTSNTSSWDKYTINSTIQYKVPGNIEATCLNEASDNIIINLDTI